MRAMLVALLACGGGKPDRDTAPAGGGPLGMVLADDGRLYAGAALVDITPSVDETWTDLDGDGTFDGCFDDPTASRDGCDEPFDDADGDGLFDARFIGGFGPLRPANGVNDPITARAVVLSVDGSYVAMVALDLVGLASPRIHPARDVLAADGFDPDRLIVSSTHNHQGPDTMGLWGDPYDFAAPITGRDDVYQEQLTLAVEEAVRRAAGAMVPVDLKVGAQQLRERDPYFTGVPFGGKNPSHRMHGLVNDIRDPVLVSDQVLVMQGSGADGTVFTLTSWSGHPEVWGGDNTQLSSDWVGVTRDKIEERYGGLAVHFPESLGGMQSALGGEMPLVLDDGTHVFQTCDAAAIADETDTECFGQHEGSDRLDRDGVQVPAWAEHSTREYVVSHGWHIAEAVFDIVDAADVAPPGPLRVDAEDFYVPVDNLAYKLLGPAGIFDLNLEDAIRDGELCPDAPDGCLLNRAFRLQIGPVTFVTAPGELFPELAWGFPTDDPDWVSESADPTARGPKYFPQHDHACDTVDPVACMATDELDGCDCLAIHVWPYGLSSDPGLGPVFDRVDTPYRAAISMTDSYLSYVVPEVDFNTWVNLLEDRDGDHYEDTVSPSARFSLHWLQAQHRIADRW